MKTLKALLPVLFTLIVFSLSAQPRQRMNQEERKENIEAMKVAFLTKELNLSPEEAQKFWPVYNAYTDELKKLRETRKERFKDSKDDFGNMSDKDVEKLVDSEIASRQQELDLLKQYHVKFKEVLPVKKVAALYRAEEKFKRQLLERIKERREGGGGNKQK
ncbi:MAG: Spy/CpxP family protein refolding chaperone [Bacteroidota bacterium]